MDVTTRRWRPVILLAVLVTCVGCDQATKRYAIENLRGQPPVSYLGDTFRIQYAENPGAFLSLMGELSRQSRFWILTVANSVVMLVVAAYLLLIRNIDRLSLAALALIVAGGVGNLIDRIMWDGVVIDFLNLGIGPLRTGVFNVADMAITGGFFLLLPQLFRSESLPQPVESGSAA
jgi:signal peptidase II